MTSSPSELKSLQMIKFSKSGSHKLLTWRVKEGEQVKMGSVLFEYQSSNQTKVSKFLSSSVGLLHRILTGEGDTLSHNAVTCELLKNCEHPEVVCGMCSLCGDNLQSGEDGAPSEQIASVPIVLGIPQILVSKKQAEDLAKEDKLRLLRQRKLALIVDLDQTLVHTSTDVNIPVGLPDVYGFRLKNYPLCYHARLRPFVHEFLNKISSIYELYIFTMGTHCYAHTLSKILDPERKLFSQRIISRDECFDSRSKLPTIRSVFPCGDEMVAIIDDREDMWARCPNLVHVKPYIFFGGTGDIHSPDVSQQQQPPTEVLQLPSPPDPIGRTDQVTHPVVETPATKLDSPEEILIQDDPVTPTPGEIDPDPTTPLADPPSIPSLPPPPLISPVPLIGPVESTPPLIPPVPLIGPVESTPPIDPLVPLANSVLSQLNATVSSSSDSSDSSESSSNSSNTSSSQAGQQNEKEKKSGKLTETAQESEIIPPTLSPTEEVKGEKGGEDDKLPEITDPDRFLLNLIDILTRVHTRFFKKYAEIQAAHGEHPSREQELSIPDLKEIIPWLRHSILRRAHIVFTGVIPTNRRPEDDPLWNTARAFGATIQSKITRADSGDREARQTTHVIASKPGTNKYREAIRIPGIHITTPEWLWACAERWTWVDEKDYPIRPLRHAKDKMGQHTKKPHLSSEGQEFGDKDDVTDLLVEPEQVCDQVPSEQMDTFDPVDKPTLPPSLHLDIPQLLVETDHLTTPCERLSFSLEDITAMSDEVDQAIDDSSSENETIGASGKQHASRKRKRPPVPESASENTTETGSSSDKEGEGSDFDYIGARLEEEFGTGPV